MASLSSAEQAIQTLFKVIEDENLFDATQPSRLSGVMARLSFFNHIIGQHLARLQADYKVERARIYDDVMKDPKAKVTHAKQLAEDGARELEQAYDHYYRVHEDTQAFINVCQSHLRILGLEAQSKI